MIRLFLYELSSTAEKPKMIHSVIWLDGTDIIISPFSIHEALGTKLFLSQHAVDPDKLALVTSLHQQYLGSDSMPPFVYRIDIEGTF